jgi:hypothetical protein
MSIYNFTHTVTKPGAFDEYIQKNFPLQAYITSTGTNISIATTRALTTDELQTLTNLVNAYTDPSEYLALQSQFTDTSSTGIHNNTSLETIKTFIQPASFINDGVFDTFKMVVKYTADSLNNFSSDSTCSLTLELFCETRQYLMKTIVFDITDIINEWKLSGLPGPFVKYKSLMISDLRFVVTNYDTIWSFKTFISNSAVTYSFNSHQSLFYNIQ